MQSVMQMIRDFIQLSEQTLTESSSDMDKSTEVLVSRDSMQSVDEEEEKFIPMYLGYAAGFFSFALKNRS